VSFVPGDCAAAAASPRTARAAVITDLVLALVLILIFFLEGRLS